MGGQPHFTKRVWGFGLCRFAGEVLCSSGIFVARLAHTCVALLCPHVLLPCCATTCCCPAVLLHTAALLCPHTLLPCCALTRCCHQMVGCIAQEAELCFMAGGEVQREREEFECAWALWLHQQVEVGLAQPLPRGWCPHTDPATGSTHFLNTRTGGQGGVGCHGGGGGSECRV